MESLGKECTPLKAKYDECFNTWFRESFLKKKDGMDHDQACGKLFQAYQQCVKAAIEHQKIDTEKLYENILDTDKEKKEP